MRTTLLPDPPTDSRPPAIRRNPRRMLPCHASRATFDRLLLKLVRKVRFQRQCATQEPLVKRPSVYAVATAMLIASLGLAPRRRTWIYARCFPRPRG